MSTDRIDINAVLSDIILFLDMGGPVFLIIVALSIVALTIIMVKIFQFMLCGIFSPASAKKGLELWRAGERSAALNAVSKRKNAVCIVLRHAMQIEAKFSDEALLREEIERISSSAFYQLRRFIKPLEFIAQTAPLLGLLGTVIGMIYAFKVLQEGGSNVDASLLAGGIWVALLTTAAGLTLAVPVNLVVAWFDSLIDKHAHETEQAVTVFLTSKRMFEFENSPSRQVKLRTAVSVGHAH